jgi:molybdopterin-guanine dinucleotide biosynthesis protein A
MIAGLILAGGRSSRMGGGDKALLMLGDGTILSHVIGRFAPQVSALAINTGSEAAEFPANGLPLVRDAIAGFQGPLAGIQAGLSWAANLPGATHLATVSVDAPFLPRDLVARLAAGDTRLVHVARSTGRLHPTCALWPLNLLADLEAFLHERETRKVTTFVEEAGYRAVDFEAEPFDPFFNINTPEDLAAAIVMLDRAS